MVSKTTGEITKNGQSWLLNSPWRSPSNQANQSQAIIRANADLTDYRTADDNTEKVPNTAKYIVNDDPEHLRESEPVTVTPPPTTYQSTDRQWCRTAQLHDKAEEFECVVPSTQGSTQHYWIRNKNRTVLEPVLEVKGNNSVTLDGKAIAADQRLKFIGDRQNATEA